MQPGGDRSLSRSGAHHGARSPTTSANVSWLCTSQRWRLLEREVDQPVVGVVGEDLLQQPAGDRRDRLLHEAAGSAPPRPARRRPRPRAGAARWPTVPPSATTRRALRARAATRRPRAAMSAAASRSRITASWRKFSAKNSSRLLPNSSFLRDQRRVRDRQPERVPEQRGDREPVGDRADHAGLGAGVDEAPEPVLSSVSDVHHGGEDQQAPATACIRRSRVRRRPSASVSAVIREPVASIGRSSSPEPIEPSFGFFPALDCAGATPSPGPGRRSARAGPGRLLSSPGDCCAVNPPLTGSRPPST